MFVCVSSGLRPVNSDLCLGVSPNTTQLCHIPCPVECEVSSWRAWGPCTFENCQDQSTKKGKHLLQLCLGSSRFTHLAKTERINKTSSFIVNRMNCVREAFQHITHSTPPLTSICAISIRAINLSTPTGAEDSFSQKFMNQEHCRGNNKQKGPTEK